MSHACGHSHQNYGWRFILGILLNLIFILIELYYGFKSNSSALIADAVHNFADVLGLIISFIGFMLLKVKNSNTLTFGLKNATIFTSFLNSVFLFIGTFYVLKESYEKFFLTAEIIPINMIIVASIGVVINGLTALLFISGAKHDINIKSTFLHLLSDALISLAVVVGGIVILYTGFFKIDSILSILISIFIMFASYGVFKESIKLMFLGVPSAIKLEEVKKSILEFEGVLSVHDLHILALSTKENLISLHLVKKDTFSLSKLYDYLKKNFPLHHITIQVEEEHEECNFKLCN